MVNVQADQQKTIGYKWVMKRKRDKANRICQYKARLTAQGFTQEKGVDYNLLLCIAQLWTLETFHLDVSGAYL